MALSRRTKLAIGGTVLAGVAALTTTGVAFAATGEPSLRITETVDDADTSGSSGGVTGAGDDGNCTHDGGTSGASNQR